jgi:hypothetical protein
MIRVLLFVAFGFLAIPGVAHAQDGKGKGAEIYKLVMDNDRVRVYQAQFKPGDKMPARNFPSHLVYMVTDGTLVFAPAGRTAYEMTFKAGDTQWFPAQSRAMENYSDQEVRLLVVEIKEGAIRTSVRGKAKGKRKRRR